jgi:hypothetical protein
LPKSLTGIARPKVVLPRPRKANAFLFEGDGETPNNPRFPLIFYRSPVSLTDAADPAAVFEVLFAANQWKPAWRDSIYPYNHFHTGTHETVGIASGHARVRLGAKRGASSKCGPVMWSSIPQAWAINGYPAQKTYWSWALIPEPAVLTSHGLGTSITSWRSGTSPRSACPIATRSMARWTIDDDLAGRVISQSPSHSCAT